MRYDIVAYVFVTSPVGFMVAASAFIYMERYLQSLLSFMIGMMFLSSTLVIIRESSSVGKRSSTLAI